MQKLITKIQAQTQALDLAEKAGDMPAYDRILKRRGAAILGALNLGASPDYLKEITR